MALVMQLSSRSSSSAKERGSQQNSGSRIRKKHKRLDAISEEEYKRNHAESNGRDEGSGDKDAEMEIRRSSRVRKPPELLDASPPPVKKRRRNGVGKKSLNNSGKSRLASVEEEESDEGEDLEGLESWRSRLRTRGKKLGVGVKKVKGKASLTRRKLLDDETCGREDVDMSGVKEGKAVVSELDSGKMMVVKSKRPGRVKATIGLRDREDMDMSGVKEGKEAEEVEGRGNMTNDGATDAPREEDGGPHRELVDHLFEGSPLEGRNADGANEKALENLTAGSPVEVSKGDDTNDTETVNNLAEESASVFSSEIHGGNARKVVDCSAVELDQGEERVINGMQSDEGFFDNENVVAAETMEIKEQHHAEELQLKSQNEVTNQEDAVMIDEVEEFGNSDTKGDELLKVYDKPLEVENVSKVDKFNQVAARTLGKAQIKQGRRCGLCGCGTDGKPPKKSAQDTCESENDAYSSPASEEPNYDVWDGFGDEPGWLGRLLGPVDDRHGIARIWVHQNCAVWSPEVYFAGLGRLKNIKAALCRGRALKCSRCERPGATIGCRVDRCPKTYHLPCARDKGCIFDHRKFLIACTDHRYLFQPHGNQYLAHIKKIKTRKMRFELRKVSNDACRKDIESEEKWMEHWGEDEEFVKREKKRLHRDLLRIAPTYIGGSDSENEKLFGGWESVAGLQDVIRCMKEVVILPLLYPEFFSNMGLTPPRGVLLHGYPGTGKTLVVRALIGSCARGDKRIAYFARKGADCLGKYVGDAERQLRLLFQVAEKCQPSIIFFDEIDGLAPCRTRQQDQTHNSVVSTLLALLDGLKSRGSVVVIGATNRPDAVDPALRRPGRFDREIYFPLPSMEDRAAILALHTQRWPKPVAGSLLKWVARQTPGFAGADLQALCTQAAIIALKKNFPLHEIMSAAETKPHNAQRAPIPRFAVEERDWLEALSCAAPPCSRREAGITAHDIVASPLPTHLIPCFLQPLSSLLVSLSLDDRLWLPPLLSKGAAMVESVIVSALDNKRLPRGQWWTYVNDFLEEADIAKEIEKRLSNIGLFIGEPSFAGSDSLSDNVADNGANLETSEILRGSSCANSFQGTSFGSRNKKGFRVLIGGSPGCGQRHLASCLLQCFLGNVEIQKVDLATISQEGRGDLVDGVTQILMRCASVGSCLVYMPRIDLWALELHQDAVDNASFSTDDQHTMMEDLQPEENYCPTGKQPTVMELPVEEENESFPQQCDFAEEAEPQFVATHSASHVWSSFVEQVESISASTSLMILATSEVPYLALPDKVSQFFKGGSSNLNQNMSEYTVPRFSVHIGDDINHDVLIKQSAAKLSREIVQLFIHLIHQRSHVKADMKIDDVIQDYTAKVSNSVKNSKPSEVGAGSQSCVTSSTEVPPPPPSNKLLKMRSSLMVAIPAFGYQILRYPHFAELCWITSKLKEGPCADVRGPWKGWPFNTCIIRPATSLDEAVACASSNLKIKEKCNLVRGLVAVGLSAYRGEYTSCREVSFELRKVLELLVGWINSKVSAGKDRYQYLRILSQVACLEDMVNNWAYALRSLDQDANPKSSILGSPDNHPTCDTRPDHTGNGEADVPDENGPTLKEKDSSPVEVSVHCIDLNIGVDDVPSPEGRGVILKEAVEQVDRSDTGTTEELLDCSAAANTSIMNVEKQNGSHPGSFVSKISANITVVGGDTRSEKQPDKTAARESVTTLQNGFPSSVELCSTKLSVSLEDRNHINTSLAGSRITSDDSKLKESQCREDTNFSSNQTTLPSVCFYNSCSRCQHTILNLMQKFLDRELKLDKSQWTIDYVHDTIASLSADLLSAISDVYIAGSSITKLPKSQMHGNHGDLCVCYCRSKGNGVVISKECSCHFGGSESSETQSGSDLKFIFRDGVMVPLDSDPDVSFHCKFETLCLCSLIESIVTTQQQTF